MFATDPPRCARLSHKAEHSELLCLYQGPNLLSIQIYPNLHIWHSGVTWRPLCYGSPASFAANTQVFSLDVQTVAKVYILRSDIST